jgi:nicotinate-nucleotide adenylyltransferase
MADRVGIFGGVFDPVHVGHLSISRSFLESNLIDYLLVLPSPAPPHKKNRTIVSLEHRIKMLRIAYKSWEDVIISNLETRLPAPSYTLQTINYLQESNPENVYFLCIGEDSLKNFKHWFRYKQILEKVTLMVAERPEVTDYHIAEEILEKSIFVDHKPINISSTTIRQQADMGLKISDDLPDEVFDYIMKYQLYGL